MFPIEKKCSSFIGLHFLNKQKEEYQKGDRCGEFYILASEKIPDSNETFAYSNVIQDSVLEISYYPDKPKEKYDLCKKCTNMLINFLKEKKENTIYEK